MGRFSRLAMVIVPRTYGVGMCGVFEFFTICPFPGESALITTTVTERGYCVGPGGGLDEKQVKRDLDVLANLLPEIFSIKYLDAGTAAARKENEMRRSALSCLFVRLCRGHHILVAARSFA